MTVDQLILLSRVSPHTRGVYRNSAMHCDGASVRLPSYEGVYRNYLDEYGVKVGESLLIRGGVYRNYRNIIANLILFHAELSPLVRGECIETSPKRPHWHGYVSPHTRGVYRNIETGLYP